MPEYFGQTAAFREFGVPSDGSLDSGYEEMDPFDKRVQYQNANTLSFDQSCTINQLPTAHLNFGGFGYAPAATQPGSTNFGVYSGPELASPFQPILNPINAHGQYRPSPSLEEISEDGRTASMSSGSPQQASFGFETSPRMEERSSWPDRSNGLKRRATESSMELRFPIEDRVPPKAAPTRGRPRKRIPHTAVERRYRENLNAHLEKLRAAVPNLTSAQRRKSSDGSDPLKPSKCEVLMGAVDYIQRLEAENERLKGKTDNGSDYKVPAE